MNADKAISRSAYLVALMLFFYPLIDAVTSVLPLRVGEETWRFGAIGVLSNMTLLPVTGLLLATIVAAWFEHRQVRRVIGWICAILAVVFAAVALLFVLDALQARASYNPQYRSSITVATLTSLFKQAGTIVGLAPICRAAWDGPKEIKRRQPKPMVREYTLIPSSAQPRTE